MPNISEVNNSKKSIESPKLKKQQDKKREEKEREVDYGQDQSSIDCES